MYEPLVKSIKFIFNPNYWPWAAIFDQNTDFRPFLGPEWRSRGPVSVLNVLESIEKSIGMYNPPIKSIKTILNPNHWPWAAIFNQKYWFSAIFGPERKVHRSIEGPKCIGLHRKIIRDVRTTNKIDQNRFKAKGIDHQPSCLTENTIYWCYMPLGPQKSSF